MKILVISDLHNDVKATEEILRYFDENHFNKLFILGDIGYYCLEYLNPYADKITAVAGNNDYDDVIEASKFPLPLINYAYDFNKLFVLTHGHIYNEYNYSKPFDIMLLGHSHIKRLAVDYDNHIIANPGSLSRPRDGIASFMTIDEKGIYLHSRSSKEVIQKLEF